MQKSLIAMVVVATGCLSANGLSGAENDGITFHDLSTRPLISRGSSAKLKAIVTDTGSFMTGEISAEYRQAPHHHDQEQVTLGIAGKFQLSIGGVQHRVEPYFAGIPPSNVAHFMTNDSGQVATILEFQPIARRDWIDMTATSSYRTDEAAVLPQNQPVTANMSLDSDGWRVEKSGARVKSFSGKTIRVDMWDLSAANASADLTSGQPKTQRFVYVFEGTATFTAGAIRREIGREMCVEVGPAVDRVGIRSTGSGRAVIGVFQSLAR